MLKIILLCFIIFNAIMYNFIHSKYMNNKYMNVTEGYESLETCLKQGYPKSFCFQVPIQACLTNCG